MPQSLSGRNWIGTVHSRHNNGAQLDEKTGELLMLQLSEKDGVRGVMGQLERGGGGRVHLQIYIELKRAFRLAGLNRLQKAHWERRRGSREQCMEYCRKDDTRIAGPWQFGQWELRPGRRSDLEAVKEQIDRGCSLKQIAQDNFGTYVKYHRGIKDYLQLSNPSRNWPMEVRIFWGETGTGKTRAVYEKAEELGERVYAVTQTNSGTVWWDGYDGEEIALFDDFYGWCRVSYLLKLLDRYPMRVETKGGFVQFTSKKIYFTSNNRWDEWYDWDRLGQQVKLAFERRISIVTHFAQLNQYDSS